VVKVVWVILSQKKTQNRVQANCMSNQLKTPKADGKSVPNDSNKKIL
jgi:hypothetical protein